MQESLSVKLHFVAAAEHMSLKFDPFPFEYSPTPSFLHAMLPKLPPICHVDGEEEE
jgi:hypothetical protein